MKISVALRCLLAIAALSMPTLLPATDDATVPAPAPSGVHLQVGSISLSTGSAAAPASSVQPAQPKPEPFIFEIRNGFIIENDKPVSEATIGKILDYLKLKGKTFNIILGPGVTNLRINDLVLNLPEFDGNAVFEAIAASVRDEVTSSIAPRAGIYQLDLAQDSARQVQVFNLTDYLNPDGKADDKTIQDKLASLQDIIFKTLRDMDPAFSDAVQPHYQFHQGANLLIVIGTPESLMVANQVVNALQPPDGNPRREELKNIITQWGNIDPAAAEAWAGSLQNTQLGAAGINAEIQNLLSQLKTEAENKSLSAQQLQDLQNRIYLLNKQIQDMMSQGFDVAPRVAPEKITSP